MRWFQITYDAGGGAFSDGSTSKLETYPESTRIADVVEHFNDSLPTKDGYQFNGWWTYPDGEGDEETEQLLASWGAYTLGQIYPESAGNELTVSARWIQNGEQEPQPEPEPTTFTITFDSNGGSAIEPMVLEPGASITPPDNPTREGYEFVEWTPPIPETMPDEDVTCVAKWKRNQYTVTLDSQGGTPIGYIKSIYHGDPIVNIPAPTKLGMRFNGWWTEKEGGEILTSATPITQAGTFYAHWMSAKYAIHWNANGGVSSMSVQNLDYGTNIMDLPTAKRHGYTLAGWWTKVNGGSQVSTPLKVTKDITYYAHWDPVPCTLSWDSNGGTYAADTIRPYGDTIGTLPQSTKTRNTLKGWYTEDGERVTYQTVVSDDTTFHAQWDPDTYFIQYNLQGRGTMPEDAKESGTYEELLDYTPPNPLGAKGYSFMGWEANDRMDDGGGMTYTAQWMEKEEDEGENDEGDGEDAPEEDVFPDSADSTLLGEMALCCVCDTTSGTTINDWVKYHLDQGFERIYLYYAGFETNMIGKYLDEEYYENGGPVTLVDGDAWDWEERSVEKAYAHCYRTYRKHHTWMGFVQPNERILLPEAMDVREVFYGHSNYRGYDVVRLNCVEFSDQRRLYMDMAMSLELLDDEDGDDEDSMFFAKSIVRCTTTGIDIGTNVPLKCGQLPPQCMPDGEIALPGELETMTVDRLELSEMYITTNFNEVYWVNWKKQRERQD